MAVWLPRLATDLVRRRERGSGEHARAVPLVLAADERQRRVVAACCDDASRAGVRTGMPVVQARALFPSGVVRVEDHDVPRTQAALRSLAVWAIRFSPMSSIDEPDGLMLDVTGCARVFGGEPALAQRASSGLRRLGFETHIALAPTYAAARAIARFGGAREAVIGQHRIREAVSSLPVHAIGVEDAVTDELRGLGLERVGQVLAMPRPALAARFGETLNLQLDRMLGQSIETITPVRPTPPLTVERLFKGPTTNTEAIERTARELVDEVGSALLAREAGAMSLELELERSDLPPERLTIATGRPTRDRRHLWSLVRPGLERAHLGFGVEAVRVRVRTMGALRHEQTTVGQGDGAASDREAERARGELVDTLANRLGSARVLRAHPVESHRPERAFTLAPATHQTPQRHPVTTTTHDRPTALFDRPAPAEVVALTPDGPVHRVRWDHGGRGGAWRGGDESVIACVGPERISGEWWDHAGSTRDYFVVQTESGRWLWVCRGLEVGRWFVHGEWA
jgi:protein ImuB